MSSVLDVTKVGNRAKTGDTQPFPTLSFSECVMLSSCAVSLVKCLDIAAGLKVNSRPSGLGKIYVLQVYDYQLASPTPHLSSL